MELLSKYSTSCSFTIFSITLEITLRREIGLKFALSVISDDLYNGKTFAILKTFGKIPDLILRLTMCKMGFKSKSAFSFRRDAGNSSHPGAVQ